MKKGIYLSSFENIIFSKYFIFTSFLFLYMPSRIVSLIPVYIKTPIKLLLILIILLYYLFKYVCKLKISLYILVYTVLAFLTIFITFINNGYYISAIYNDTLIILSLIILIHISINNNLLLFFKTFSLYCFFIIVLNFFVELVFEIILKYKWTDVCIFGNTNINFDYFYYFFVLHSTLYFLMKKKIDLYILLIGTILCLFDGKFHNCHTTNICLIVLILSFIVINFDGLYLKIFNFINPCFSLLFNVIFYFCFILEFNGISIGQKISSIFLNGMKDFNGRMILWKFGIKSILERPFGHGLATERSIQGINSKLSTFHHTFIQTGYEIGIPGLILIMVLILLVCYSINKISWKKLKFYYSIIILMFLLRFQMSSDAKACFYSFLAYLYCVSPFLDRYVKS